MFRIKSLNNTLQSVKESFDINREQLLKVMNTANTVEGQTVQLQQNTSRTAVTVDRVNDTVREKLSSAQETLFNVTTLKEQLVTLRNISHSQMLRARGEYTYIHSMESYKYDINLDTNIDMNIKISINLDTNIDISIKISILSILISISKSVLILISILISVSKSILVLRSILILTIRINDR